MRLFISVRSLAYPPKATCSLSLPSPSSCGTGEPSPLTSVLPLHPRRPIYNGYMKVCTLSSPFQPSLDPLSRNKPCITVRLVHLSPPRVSTPARHVLFLWWIPPPLQPLHVRPSSHPSLTSHTLLQDHRHSQHRFCWSHPNYSDVLPGSLGSGHPRRDRHHWLVSARRRQCFLLPPGMPCFRSHTTDD